MTGSAAGEATASDSSGQGSIPLGLQRYSLPVLAQMAGLKAVQPLERLLSLPRYSARLERFFLTVAERPEPVGLPPRHHSSAGPAARFETLFEGLGLCWGLARLRGALTPQDMVVLRESFAPDVLAFANTGLAQVRVAPALAAPSGVSGLTPENCRSFGKAVFLGWLEGSPEGAYSGLAEGLRAATIGHETRRIAALDDLIASFMHQLEVGR